MRLLWQWLIVAGMANALYMNSGAPATPLARELGALEFETKYKDELERLARLKSEVNHTDHYRDTFSLSITAAMHKRILKLRNLLRSQGNDLEALRGKRVVRSSCH